MTNDKRFSDGNIQGKIDAFKKLTGKDPLDVSFDDFLENGYLKGTPPKSKPIVSKDTPLKSKKNPLQSKDTQKSVSKPLVSEKFKKFLDSHEKVYH